MRKLTAFIVLATALAVFHPGPAPAAPPVGQLNSFSYSYGGFHAAWEYTLFRSGDEVLLLAKGLNGVNLDVHKKLDPQVLDLLYDIMVKNDVLTWNGFSGEDRGVLDGPGFSLTVVFDNYTVTAAGYAKEPQNYQAGHRALVAFLESLVEEK